MRYLVNKKAYLEINKLFIEGKQLEKDDNGYFTLSPREVSILMKLNYQLFPEIVNDIVEIKEEEKEDKKEEVVNVNEFKQSENLVTDTSGRSKRGRSSNKSNTKQK